MSATDELRRLLDGRGVEYLTYGTGSQTSWITEHPSAGNGWQATFANVHEKPTTHNMLLYWKVTPEQAVQATLGRGTCRIVTTWSDSDYVDGWRYRCSECMCFIPVNERDLETGEVISAANYCPNCGRKVEA